MKAVLTLSKTFPKGHYRVGESTNFAEKVLSGEKKHTCRANYDYWKDRIDRLKEKGGVLSVRKWIGESYNKPGQETIVDIHADIVGVQKLELSRKNEYFFSGLTLTQYYEYKAIVEDKIISLSQLADNDGLTIKEFEDWFTQMFDKGKSDVLHLAIIHFTKEMY